MARIVLVTGGARSGKSAYALKTAHSLPGPRAFVATCPVIDAEMEQRVRKHRQARCRAGWHTIEETTDLARVLRNAREYRVLLVDCLTLWINNLMHEAAQSGQEVDEEAIAERTRQLIDACAERAGTVLFVANEVGMGIVPENAAARRYRDLAGRCSQIMAEGADVVTLVVCGIPVTLRQGSAHGPA